MKHSIYDLEGLNKNDLERWVEKYRIAESFETAFDGKTGAVFYTRDFSKCFCFDFSLMKLEVDRR